MKTKAPAQSADMSNDKAARDRSTGGISISGAMTDGAMVDGAMAKAEMASAETAKGDMTSSEIGSGEARGAVSAHNIKDNDIRTDETARKIASAINRQIYKVAVPLPLGRGQIIAYDYLGPADFESYSPESHVSESHGSDSGNTELDNAGSGIDGFGYPNLNKLESHNTEPDNINDAGMRAKDHIVDADIMRSGISVGQLVEVPVGRRLLWGIVISVQEYADIEIKKLKPIHQISELPALHQRNLDFLEQVARWTVAPFGAVLRMMLSVPSACLPAPTEQVYHLPLTIQRDALQGQPLSAARQRVLQFLDQAPPLPAAIISRETGTATTTIKAMYLAGQLASWHQSKPDQLPEMSLSETELSLTDAQSEIAIGICKALNSFQVHLLDGVTGSGKTEVYFQAVRQALASGQQILILLPEIALTKSFQDRFESWFGTPPFVWHSSVTASRKRAIWRAAISGTPMVVVGARSALFLPFSKLGLIVVDEEHDAAFKQEDQVIYQARDMAVLRAKTSDIPVILSSATPSLESWANMQQGRYRHWQLTHRYGAADMPKLQTIDLRQQAPERGKWLSQPLVQAIEATLEAGNQTLLYLNRRGYAPMAICASCGDRRICYQCDSLLVTHRLVGRQICHQCGTAQPVQKDCSACGEVDSMQLVGPGVERLAEEVLTRFPEARFTIFSSDALAGKAATDESLRAIIDGEVDIIIGTQMAAKGHHFPDLTLVGVVDGDLGLQGGDLRGAERTFQMLMQVAGRAGRGQKPGRALIQTSAPDHPVITALQAGDRDMFFAQELQARQAAQMPPYGRLAALILTDTQLSRLEEVAQALAKAVPAFETVYIFGPAPAPIAQIRGRHRIRFLISAPRHVDIQRILKDWTEQVKLPSSTRLQIDIDPYNFL